MKKVTFYPKLAINNLKKHKSTYFPYMLVCIVSIIMFYILNSLYVNPGLQDLRGSAALESIFFMGLIVLGLFSAIIFFYTNSFLLKRRQKEFALYDILGLEKKHISRILFFENILSSLISLILGLALGTLLSRLVFLIFSKAVDFPNPLRFEINSEALSTTVIVFATIYTCILFINMIRIRLSKPIALITGEHTGEKEPKGSWILTIIGVLCLGTGYYIAISTESPITALSSFFIAVLAVIIGTYCLFTSISISVLKLMKSRRKFYYKPRNFVTVSGMLYRMKQNAVGLATICILSTMVLVTISTTVSLFMGIEATSRWTIPDDLIVTYEPEQKENASIIFKQMHEQGLSNEITFSMTTVMTMRDENSFVLLPRDTTFPDPAKISMFEILILEDYNRFENRNLNLENNELLLFSETNEYPYPEMKIGDTVYGIRENLDQIQIAEKRGTSYYQSYLLILKDTAAVTGLLDVLGADDEADTTYQTIFDIETTDSGEDIYQKAVSLCEQIEAQIPGAYTRSFYIYRQESYSLNFGFLFLGIFLGFLFLSVAALIIYYKQISEGQQDHHRFEIMQKVGMGKKEVKQTINRQILLIFFLPLVTSILHIIAATKLISRILLMFGLPDVNLIIQCIGITIIAFSIFYTIIYKVTARTYYNLVA